MDDGATSSLAPGTVRVTRTSSRTRQPRRPGVTFQVPGASRTSLPRIPQLDAPPRDILFGAWHRPGHENVIAHAAVAATRGDLPGARRVEDIATTAPAARRAAARCP